MKMNYYVNLAKHILKKVHSQILPQVTGTNTLPSMVNK